MEWIIALLSGAAGGNIAGGVLKNYSLGTIGNSIAGIVGGGLGAWILSLFTAAEAGGLTVAGIVQQVASGGIGGAVVLVVVGIIRGMMGSKA